MKPPTETARWRISDYVALEIRSPRPHAYIITNAGSVDEDAHGIGLDGVKNLIEAAQAAQEWIERHP